MADEDVIVEIQSIIDDDPIIGGKNITVTLEKKGFLGRNKSILLIGNPGSEKNKERAEEIAHKWAGKMNVVSNLIV